VGVGGRKLWERSERRSRPKQRTARGPPLARATVYNILAVLSYRIYTPTPLFSRAVRADSGQNTTQQPTATAYVS